ncbi:hypothetical protein JHK87_033879 [Glycine soja]|nr:hypothetical protein JHK87_033879 [Glycine soja]
MKPCHLTFHNKITHMEMIKGIKGHGYYDELVVPIIENTAYEYELTEALAKAIEAYTKTTAVLVRNHGIYVWGDSWISAKTLAECYHYLFDATIKLHQLGLDWSTPNHGPIQSIRSLMIAGESNASDKTRKANGEIDPFPLTSNANGQFLRHFEIHGVVFPCNFNFNSRSLSPFVLQCCIVLDIEGNTTPISFVTEVLFPYACQNVGRHLSMTYDTPETESDIKLLCSQGPMWRTGYENNELKGIVFDDVPEALEKWHALGIKVYIYSSGSRLAQRLIFEHTNHGDLRKYLSGFLDTTVGNKRETHSYVKISESLGIDKPSDILFVTDVYQEATAAKAAGLEVIISVRPGNAPLPENHGFKMINSFSEI